MARVNFKQVNYKQKSVHKNKGTALVTGIVFSALLTGLAVTLLSNSVMDQRISGAYAELAESVDTTRGGIAAVIHSAVTKQNSSGKNFLTVNIDRKEANLQLISPLSYDLDAYLPNETECPRTKNASDGILKCHFFRLNVTNKYGKYKDVEDSASVTAINAGIAQQMMHIQ